MTLIRKSLETAALGIVAFFLSGALQVLFASGNMEADGDKRFEAILTALYLAVLVIGLIHFGRTYYATIHMPALVGLMLLACFSAAWAEAPGLVLRRSIGLAGTSLFGIVFGGLLSSSEQLKVLRWLFRIIAALSLAMVIVSPAHGISSSIEAGAWRGIFNHKNGLGGAMALAVLVEWLYPVRALLPKLSKMAWLGLYGALLVFSNSITSALAIVLTLAIVYTYRIFHGQYKLPLPALFAFVLFVGGFLFANKNSVTGGLGRSSDITGRTELWHWVVAMILRRPFLGYGFSGFWRGGSSEYASVERIIGWSPMYSHNGYLEILLSLGVAGLVLFAWMMAVGFWRALKQAEFGKSVYDLWPLAFLVYFLLHNLGECTILWQNCLEWSLCISVVVCADPIFRTTSEIEDAEPDMAFTSAAEFV